MNAKTLNTKRLFILAVLHFFILNWAQAQQPLTILIKDSLTDDVINTAVELPDGNLLLAGIKQDQTLCNALLYEVDPYGTPIRSKIFNHNGQISGIDNLMLTDSNSFIMSGYAQVDSKFNLWLIKMDFKMNILDEQVFPLGDYNYASSSIIRDKDHSLVCFGTVTTPDFNVFRPFLYKFSEEGDSIRLKIFEDHHTMGESDLLEFETGKGYYFFVYAFGGPTNEVGIELDSLFSVSEIHGIPNDVKQFCNAAWIDDHSFFVTGRKIYTITDRHYLGVQVLDTSFSAIHTEFLSFSDTNVFPGLRKNLDFIDPEMVYIGGTHNFNSDIFYSGNSWIFLNRTDTALNIHWQKIYGGDGNYVLYGILATRDGGCLAYGTFYNYLQQDYQRDIFLLKVDKDGKPVSVDEIPVPDRSHYLLFPNPGDDIVHVRNSLPDATMVVFFTMNGEPVCTQEPGKGSGQIQTGSLKPGIYLYRVINRNQILSTGLWLKK